MHTGILHLFMHLPHLMNSVLRPGLLLSGCPLGVASRDRALADIAAALCSLFLAAVTNTPAGSAAAGAADRRSHFDS